MFLLKTFGAGVGLEVLPAERDGLRVNGAFFVAGRFFLTDAEAFFGPLCAGFLAAAFFTDFLEA
ncbi:MAG: hypothetical protein ABJB32_06080 [Verrucomicrobiota bacterium]